MTASATTRAPSAADSDPATDSSPAATGPSRHAQDPKAALGVTGISVSQHPGLDRVVYRLVGSGGRPGWLVGYVERPTAQPQGSTVSVPGSAALQVMIAGVGYAQDTGVPDYAGPRRVRGAAGSVPPALSVTFWSRHAVGGEP